MVRDKGLKRSPLTFFHDQDDCGFLLLMPPLGTGLMPDKGTYSKWLVAILSFIPKKCDSHVMADQQSSSPHHSESDEARLTEALLSLPAQPRVRRRTNTLYSLVHRCFGDLKSAKERGYSYEDLAILFHTQLGKTITPGTLRKYMNRAAKAPDVGRVPDPGAVRESPISPIPAIRDPQGMPQPERAEPKRIPLPRPTLYVQDRRAQANEDEFETL